MTRLFGGTQRGAVMGTLALALLAGTPAGAFTFVSGSGSPGPQCGTRANPCSSLSAAVQNVQAGGTIIVLDPPDSAGSTLEINKSLSIIGPAAFYAGENHAIRIAAGSGSFVALDGLNVSGVRNPKSPAEGSSGIVVISGNVSIRNCSVANTGMGVQVEPDSRLTVSVSSCRFTSNRLAIATYAATSNTTGPIYVDNTLVEDGYFGLYAGATTVYLSNSRVIGNQQAFGTEAAGRIVSFGNNVISGNTSGETPSATIPLK